MSKNSELERRQIQFYEFPNMESGFGFHFKRMRNSNSPDIGHGRDLPVPESCEDDEARELFLQSGEHDASVVFSALANHGVDLQTGPGRILDFGSGHARVLRWFHQWANHHEAWGVDPDASKVIWCHERMSPPFHFAVSTSAPCLFFEDNFFSLVMATSMFTRLDDLFMSWINELRRVAKPEGFIYITINDENTREHLKVAEPGNYRYFMTDPVYRAFIENGTDFCSRGRNWWADVSVKREYMTDYLSRYFDILAVIENAVLPSHQTGILLRNRSRS